MSLSSLKPVVSWTASILQVPPSLPSSTTSHSAGVEPYSSIGSQTISTETCPWMHSTIRTSRWSASKSVGGRV
jgi:hypothetical protein